MNDPALSETMMMAEENEHLRAEIERLKRGMRMIVDEGESVDTRSSLSAFLAPDE